MLINEFSELSILKQVITHLAADFENPMAETQFEAVWAGGMQIVGKQDVVVVNAGDGTGGKYECLVKSQTDTDLWYHVKNTAQKGVDMLMSPVYGGAQVLQTHYCRVYLSVNKRVQRIGE